MYNVAECFWTSEQVSEWGVLSPKCLDREVRFVVLSAVVIIPRGWGCHRKWLVLKFTLIYMCEFVHEWIGGAFTLSQIWDDFLMLDWKSAVSGYLHILIKCVVALLPKLLSDCRWKYLHYCIWLMLMSGSLPMTFRLLTQKQISSIFPP